MSEHEPERSADTSDNWSAAPAGPRLSALAVDAWIGLALTFAFAWTVDALDTWRPGILLVTPLTLVWVWLAALAFLYVGRQADGQASPGEALWRVRLLARDGRDPSPRALWLRLAGVVFLVALPFATSALSDDREMVGLALAVANGLLLLSVPERLGRLRSVTSASDANFWARRACVLLWAGIFPLGLLLLAVTALSLGARLDFFTIADYAGMGATAPLPFRIAIALTNWAVRLAVPVLVVSLLPSLAGLGGWLFLLAGLRPQSAGGWAQRARRQIVRSLLTATPVIALIGAGLVEEGLGFPAFGWRPPYGSVLALAMLGAALLLGIAASARHPSRSFLDRIAGTTIVPTAPARVGGLVLASAAVAGILWLVSPGTAAVAIYEVNPLTNRLQIDRTELAPIPIARETTFVTEPLGADGLPDYGTAFNNAYRIPPDANAAVPLLELFSDTAETLAGAGAAVPPGPFVWSDLKWTEAPVGLWLPSDAPAAFQSLQSNAAVLARVHEAAEAAAEREGLWLPVNSSSLVESERISLSGYAQQVGPALLGRARMSVLDSRFADTSADLRAALQIIRALQGPKAHSYDGSMLLASKALESTRMLLPSLGTSELQRVEQPLRDMLDAGRLKAGHVSSRAYIVELVLWTRSYLLKGGHLLDDGWYDPALIDWSEALRTTNRNCDIAESVAESWPRDPASKSWRAFRDLQEEFNAVRKTAGPPRHWAKKIAENPGLRSTITRSVALQCPSRWSSWDDLLRKQTHTLASLRLHLHERQAGQFPTTLAQIDVDAVHYEGHRTEHRLDYRPHGPGTRPSSFALVLSWKDDDGEHYLCADDDGRAFDSTLTSKGRCVNPLSVSEARDGS